MILPERMRANPKGEGILTGFQNNILIRRKHYMKKRFLVFVMMCLAFVGLNMQAAMAAEVDILINKLLEKNIITQDEATQLISDMQKEGARENEAIKTVVAEAAKEEAKNNKQVLPKWVENMTIGGDVRMRFQTEDASNDTNPRRDRWRIRLRTGITSKINDQWSAAFGFATGGGTDGTDPISRNQTLTDEFQAPGARVDYAYIKYMPTKDITLMAGKIKNPIWITKDMIWDHDAMPDGLGGTFNFKASDNITFFITPGYFILKEIKETTKDPAMIAIQPGMNWKINNNLNFKVAGAYYNFMNVQGADMNVHSDGGNSRDADKKWIYRMNSTAFDAELGLKMANFLKNVSAFGEYVSSDADTDNTGWNAGIKLGESVSEKGQWQFIYNYRNLEKDAWVDWLPDSDFMGGSTGVKGSELEFSYGLSKNVSFGLDYYMNNAPIDNPANKKQNLLQVDLLVKF
jgi:hypothetical protein